jgi:hypothetical protein
MLALSLALISASLLQVAPPHPHPLMLAVPLSLPLLVIAPAHTHSETLALPLALTSLPSLQVAMPPPPLHRYWLHRSHLQQPGGLARVDLARLCEETYLRLVLHVDLAQMTAAIRLRLRLHMWYDIQLESAQDHL